MHVGRHFYAPYFVGGMPLARCVRCSVRRRVVFVVGRGATQAALVLYRALGATHWTSEKPPCRK